MVILILLNFILKIALVEMSIVFIKTLHSLVLYVIILVNYIFFDNYVFITISLVANSRLVITIPQASNARSVLLLTMATPPKERLKTVNRVRVL